MNTICLKADISLRYRFWINYNDSLYFSKFKKEECEVKKQIIARKKKVSIHTTLFFRLQNVYYLTNSNNKRLLSTGITH